MIVVKRNGREELFDKLKLSTSVIRALDGYSEDGVIEKIVDEVEKQFDKKGVISTAKIADVVERVFVEKIIEDIKWEEIAKRYVLARIYNHVYGKGGWSFFDEDDMRLSFNALKVLEARYLLKDEDGRFIETPKMMFRRVAKYIALAEDEGKREYWEKRFFDIMRRLLFIPNSPTLMNAGTRNGVLSACYVIPVRDSMATENGDGIMDAVRAMALIQQQGGGTGFDFSELRPKGDFVGSTGGVASGALSFMKLFDVTTDVIKQGGKRRGANMGVLHVWHPEIKDFIKAKTGKNKDVVLQNFNISVGIYDEFMKAVDKNESWSLINPRKTWLRVGEKRDSRYYAISRARYSIEEDWVQEEIIRELEENEWSVPLHESRIITFEEAMAIAENEGAVIERIEARKLFETIVEGAWDSGDPGLLFIDEMNRRHPTWYLGKINASNPCGEEPLLEWESCNLGSVDLSKFVVERDGVRFIDWDGIGEVVRVAVRFLDDVITMNRHPLEQLNEANRRTRKVGLGVMGLAHLFAKLGVAYDSVEALMLSNKLAEWILYNAVLESIELARERGVFPVYDREKYRRNWRTGRDLEKIMSEAGIEFVDDYSWKWNYPEIDWRKVDELVDEYGLRNGAVLSVAPTGTISIIAGASSSIEPLFALAYMRYVSVGTFLEIDRVFLTELLKRGLMSRELIEEIAERGSIEGMDLPGELKRVFRTAHDIDPEWHILHQAMWQRWVDSAVSKTINLRHDEPVETVWKAFQLAWKVGCKGITVYRDKSKSVQVLNKGLSVKKKEEKKNMVKRNGDGGEKKQLKMTASRLRIGKKEYIAVQQEYAGGCPTCDI